MGEVGLMFAEVSRVSTQHIYPTLVHLERARLVAKVEFERLVRLEGDLSD